jgi:thioredoxin 1
MIEVAQDNFESEVLRSEQPVIVAFCAPWSRPCQIFESTLDEVAATCAGRVKVVKVNADDNPDLSMWYEIQSIPTLLYFTAGNPHAKIVGIASKEAILSKLQSVCHGGAWTPPNSARRSLHHVDFFCQAPDARRVCLVGDFNDWNLAANPMQRTPDGYWRASLELPHGHHQYLFLVDGKPILDPNAAGKTRNERNEPVSLIAVS